MVTARRIVVRRVRTRVQRAALVVGAAFLIFGVLGFAPGVTAGYDRLEVAGVGSEAMLLGLFQVSVLHNIIHLSFGVAGLALARSTTGAQIYLFYGGTVYLVLWAYGVVINEDSTVNVVPFNAADNWLHLLLSVSMIGLALALTQGRDAHRF